MQKLFKVFDDRVKSKNNMCPNSWTATTTPKRKKTCTIPCDNDQWGRCQRSQPTLGNGKIIWQLLPMSFVNVGFMGITKLVIIIHG
jgi:hypothetical protein